MGVQVNEYVVISLQTTKEFGDFFSLYPTNTHRSAPLERAFFVHRKLEKFRVVEKIHTEHECMYFGYTEHENVALYTQYAHMRALSRNNGHNL